MDSRLTTAAFGITLRSVIYVVCGRNFKLEGVLTGLWDGATLHRSLRKGRRRSQTANPYFPLFICFLFDFLLIRNLDRSVAVLLGCGLGVLLADIGPDLWHSIDGNEIVHDIVQRLWPDTTQGFVPNIGTRSYSTFIVDHPRGRSQSSSSGTATPFQRIPNERVDASSLPEIPDLPTDYPEETASKRSSASSHSTTSSDSLRTSYVSRPRTPVTVPELPSMEQHVPFPSTSSAIIAVADHIPELSYEPDEGDKQSGDSTPKARPAELWPEPNEIIPDIDFADQQPLTPTRPKSPWLDIPSIPPEDNVAGPSALLPPVDEPRDDQVDDIDYVSEVSPPESIVSIGPKNSIILQAEALREQAAAALAEKDRLERERDLAARQRRYSDAFALKCQRDDAQVLADKLHKRARRRYFAAHNANQRDPSTVDVHGLKVPEAIRATETALRNIQRRGGRSLKVIVGRGLHSKNRIPVLKFKVLEAMERQGIHAQIDRRNIGVLNITLL